ncbi:MAG: hypothetical protein RL748_1430 [Pseudomonadota bacterium]|jgi:type IV pilus assembly protein PilE
MKIRNQAGITFLELMVALVIVAILSKIALSAYTEYLKRAARTEAKTVMMENMLSMEQLFTLNNSYGTAIPVLPWPRSPKVGTVKYNITVDAITPTSYILKAVPVDSSDKCGTFKIDNTGLRTLVGNSASVDTCWGNG